MPENGIELTPKDHLLRGEEILRIAKAFVSHGVDRIRLTGGEPLLRPDLVEIVQNLSLLGVSSVGLTTNGILLSKRLEQLKSAGLTGVNISLDTLQEHKFVLITRRLGFSRVFQSIHDSLSCANLHVKLNCVVMRNVNDDEVVDFVHLTKDLPLNVRFIEYMPFDGNRWNSLKFVPYREMLAKISQQFSPDRIEKISDAPNDTSKNYRVKDHLGTFGFITSMSENFCGSCNRLRLTADGNLKVCLFGNTELNLRDQLRSGISDAELMELISKAVKNKKKQHAGMSELVSQKNRPMITIGG